MPAPTPSVGARPNDLKSSDLACNPAWKTASGGRHHIFLFDGTWNDSTGINPTDFTWDASRQVWLNRHDPSQAFPPIITNVAKTHYALAPDGPRQLTHYFRGVGNDDENDALNQIAEGALSTLEEHIRHAAYCDFIQNYHQGDVISILGFSRGAASARLFAHDLATRGFASEVRIGSRYCRVRNTGELRRDVWDLTTRWGQTLVAGTQLPIAFLGVWDTVATNMSAASSAWAVPDSVGRALHCLALDEVRNLFKPTLLQYPKTRSDQMKEVWFPGGHCDVGGGYFHDALSRVTLDFMWGNWTGALAAQQLNPLAWRDDLVAQYTSTQGLAPLRHQEGGFTAGAGGVSPRELAACSGDLPRVHPSVEQFIQHGGLQFCIEGKGFPPACTIPSPAPVYQPLAYPGADKVERCDSTSWVLEAAPTPPLPASPLPK